MRTLTTYELAAMAPELRLMRPRPLSQAKLDSLDRESAGLDEWLKPRPGKGYRQLVNPAAITADPTGWHRATPKRTKLQNRRRNYNLATIAISYANQAEYDSALGCIMRAYIAGKINERTFPIPGGEHHAD